MLTVDFEELLTAKDFASLITSVAFI